jgi:hypothetical protein
MAFSQASFAAFWQFDGISAADALRARRRLRDEKMIHFIKFLCFFVEYTPKEDEMVKF